MSDEPPGNRQANRRVQDRLDRLQEIRDEFWAEGTIQQWGPETKRRIATAVMQAWDALHQYRNENILSEGEFPDVSPIRERLGKQTQVISDSPKLGERRAVKQVPAVNELDQWYLIDASEQLDDVAGKLGFGSTTADSVPNDSATEGDLKALLEARGQREAIENLPSEQEGDA